MMIIIERQIQKVRPGKWVALEEIDKKYNAVESRLGFPTKKRYQCLVGVHDTNTLIIERQWGSLAAMETAFEKASLDPEYQALGAEVVALIEGPQFELYMPLP